MKQHKWHKEIKAWADGAEIEFKVNGEGDWTLLKGTPYWECKNDLFRIKPQPKTPKQTWDEELTRSYKETIIERLRTDNNFWIEVFTAYDNAKDDEIKPQPKEPQYLYVYESKRGLNTFTTESIFVPSDVYHKYIGKIKLEVEDGN